MTESIYPLGTAARSIEIALAEVGYAEKPTNRVKYNGEKFEHPWCGDFQDWVAIQNGIKMPSQRSTVLGCNRMKDIGRGVTDKPQIGDWCYMGIDGAIMHIGIVGLVTANWVLCIEGNTSDKSQDNGGMVMIKQRMIHPKKGEFGVICFTRPKYVPYKGEFPIVELPTAKKVKK